jgi:hypothetical protein
MRFIVNPIALTPDALLSVLPPMMLLARFGTRQTSDNRPEDDQDYALR